MNEKEKGCSAANGCPCTPTPPMLVNEIARLFHARMRKHELHGVMSQDSARQIIRALSREDGCSQLDLVRRTHLKAPTVSITLRRMEEEGLVRREQDPEDLRIMRIRLTESGNEHIRTVHERLHEVDEVLMQGFTPDEVAQLLGLLERMRDNILPPELTDPTENKADTASRCRKGEPS